MSRPSELYLKTMRLVTIQPYCRLYLKNHPTLPYHVNLFRNCFNSKTNLPTWLLEHEIDFKVIATRQTVMYYLRPTYILYIIGQPLIVTEKLTKSQKLNMVTGA